MRNLLKIMLLLSLALAASACLAAEPQIKMIAPPGLQRGSQATLVVHGSRLADAQEILFYSPGLTVQKLEVVDAAKLQVQLAAAADCRLGMHALRVRTKTGLSNLLTLAVGALPETAELEPNGDFASPQTIALDTTVTGVVTREDVDYFVVQAQKGQRITAELEGLRLGLTFFDPYVAILDPQRFELARSDDSALLRQDPVCSLIAPADGNYVVQVRDSAFEGDQRCRYRLHVGRFPRPRAVLPAGGPAGQALDVTWLGGPGQPRAGQVVLPPADLIPKLEIARAPVFAEDEQGSAPSPNFVRISDLANVVESEPNNAVDKATVFTAPAALNGVIDTAGDVDRFKFTAPKDAHFDVQVFARRVIRSPLDSVLRVRDGKGKRLAGNDDENGPDSYLRFQAPADGDYIIEVEDHRGRGGADFVYRIEVAPVQPRLAVYLPEQERYISTTLVVPRGNRMALMVGARRSDWDGPLQLEFDGLPAGITAQAPRIAPGRGEVPVLFTATDEAEPAGRLVGVRARPAEGKPPIVGHLQQHTMLVRGQNNRDVWGHDADRMCTVVTRQATFKLDIVPPKAPLVRNGSMQLKIVATRQQDFQAPISLKMLYDPPGVASSGTIKIAEGQTEAVIPLTANGSAPLQRWPIIVVGRAPSAGGGQVQVSSGLVELDVADHFVELAFGTTAVERGKSTSLPLKITQKREFAGTAKLELVGLPPGATSSPLEFDKQAAELAVPIHAAQDARLGRHKTILCRVTVTEQGEPVVHTLGTGELRIDPPLQPKPAPAVVAKTKPPQEKPQPKALSRLELLRQQRKAEESQP